MNEKYKCSVCGTVYDPVKGDHYENICPGTEFSSLPPTWRCPVCRALKEKFSPGPMTTGDKNPVEFSFLKIITVYLCHFRTRGSLPKGNYT